MILDEPKTDGVAWRSYEFDVSPGIDLWPLMRLYEDGRCLAYIHCDPASWQDLREGAERVVRAWAGRQ